MLAVASIDHDRAKAALSASDSPLAKTPRENRASDNAKAQAAAKSKASAAAKSKARKKAKKAAKARKKQRR